MTLVTVPKKKVKTGHSKQKLARVQFDMESERIPCTSGTTTIVEPKISTSTKIPRTIRTDNTVTSKTSTTDKENDTIEVLSDSDDVLEDVSDTNADVSANSDVSPTPLKKIRKSELKKVPTVETKEGAKILNVDTETDIFDDDVSMPSTGSLDGRITNLGLESTD